MFNQTLANIPIIPGAQSANGASSVPSTKEQLEDILPMVEATAPVSKGWPKRYEPEPVISQTSILGSGVALFVMAYVWPPMILLLTFVAARFIPYCFRTNDDASVRRMLYQDFRGQQWLPKDFRETPEDIQVEERYWANKRGMCLLTCIMYPTKKPVRAVICFAHGYSDHSSFMHRVEHQRMVRRGVAVVHIEVEGHGRSDGPSGLISDWDQMTGDVRDFFKEVHDTRFQGKPFFLMGESMGGAVAYSVYNLVPDIFRGVVLQSPMCGISEDLLPPKMLVDLLIRLVHPESYTSFLGYLPLAPTDGTIAEKMGPNKECLALLETCPTAYGRDPRLTTAKTLLDATVEISESLSRFNAPFLVQHGSADQVTDPKLSQALYDESISKDKTIQLYEGMWHSLTLGEYDDNKERVFNDAIQWILERS